MAKQSVEQKLESVHKDYLVQAYREIPRRLVFRLEDKVTAGIPDVVVTGEGRTLWVEVKRYPGVTSSGMQELNMKRLWKCSGRRSWYVVCDGLDNHERTIWLMTPQEFSDWDTTQRPDTRIIGKEGPAFDYAGAVVALDELLRKGWPVE